MQKIHLFVHIYNKYYSGLLWTLKLM
uniref:Uncharacterized protein n=1 Tax=Arundo donax TaxID=35708 RepID=A0A0A8YZ35_ARUDO